MQKSYLWHLKVLVSYLRGQLTNHDTPPLLPASGRIQFAPGPKDSPWRATQDYTPDPTKDKTDYG